MKNKFKVKSEEKTAFYYSSFMRKKNFRVKVLKYSEK